MLQCLVSYWLAYFHSDTRIRLAGKICLKDSDVKVTLKSNRFIDHQLHCSNVITNVIKVM